MRNRLRSIFIILAIIVLSVSLVTVIGADSKAVARVGKAEYDSLPEAFAAAKEGEIVVLIDNATLDEPIVINKSVSLNMNSYSLLAESEKCFVVNSDSEFSIIGEGEINTYGYLIYATAPGQTTTIESDPGRLIINSEDEFAYVGGGDLIFRGATVNAENKYSTHSIVVAGSGNLDLLYTEIFHKAASAVNACISIADSGTLYMNYSTILSNATCLMLRDDAAGKPTEGSSYGEIFLVENSKIISRTNRKDAVAIGRSSVPNGIMTLRNSYVEASYRLIELKLDTVSESELVTPENNISKIYCYDTILHHNGFTNDSVTVSRTTNVYLYGNSAVTTARTASATSSNDYALVFTEGTRLSTLLVASPRIKLYDVAAAKIFLPSDPECTLGFAYDPVGNQNAPYKVVKKSEASAELLLPVTQLYLSDFISSKENKILSERVDGTSKANTSLSGYSGNLAFASAFWWNFSGYLLEGKGASERDGDPYNTCFKYCTPDDFQMPAVPSFTFGYSGTLGRDLLEVDEDTGKHKYEVITAELEFRTDTGAYNPFRLYLQSRKDEKGSGSDNSAASILVGNDGRISYIKNGAKTTATSVYATTDGTWNSVKVVIYRDKYGSGDQGKAFFYVNGEQIFSDWAYNADKNETAYFYGFRLDVTKNKTGAGWSISIDNVIIRTYASAYSGMSEGKGTYAYDSKYFTDHEPNTYSSAGIAGILFPSFEDALDKAEELGACVTLYDDITSDHELKKNCNIRANGHSLKVKDSSYSSETVYDSEGKPYLYTFDEKYSSMKTNVAFYVGPIDNPDYFDLNNYIILNDISVGSDFSDSIPTLSGLADAKTGTVTYHSGWKASFADKTFGMEVPAVTYGEAQYINAFLGGIGVYYPTFSEAKAAALVLDASGKAQGFLIEGESFNYEGSAWQTFKDGETFVLLSDIEAGSSLTREFKDGTYNIDLNGHKMLYKHNGTFAKISDNATVNVYSSAPGGVLFAAGVKNSDFSGIMFSMRSSAGDDLEGNRTPATPCNTALNIGKVGNAEGENLTLSGDLIIEARQGDASSSVTVDGSDIVRAGSSASAAILSTYYNGKINIKNLNFYGLKSSIFIGNRSEGTFSRAEAVIDNVYIITDTTSDEAVKNLVGPSSQGFRSILFTNTVSTARFNDCSGGIRYGEGCASVKIAGTTAKGTSSYIYDAPMILPEMGSETYVKVAIPSLDSSNNITFDKYLYVFASGNDAATFDDASMVKVLPQLSAKVIKPEDAVTATFVDLEGNVLSEIDYAAGSIIRSYPEGTVIPDFDGEMIKATSENLKFMETWIIEDMTIAPKPWQYSSELKADLEYSFGVGHFGAQSAKVYFPIEYKPYLKSVGPIGFVDYLLSEADTDNDGIMDKLVLELNYAESRIESMGIPYFLTFEEKYAVATINLPQLAFKYAIGSILSDESISEEDKKYAYAMAEYTHESMKYLGEEYDLSQVLETYSEYKTEKPDTIEGAISELKLGEVFEGATVSVKNSPTFIFNLKEGFSGEITLKIGDKIETFTVSETDSREVSIAPKGAKDYSKDVEITVLGKLNGSDISATYKYNLATFINYHVANASDQSSPSREESEKCLSILFALYNYATLA
ncbi:MAG: hypothetical protein IJY18_03720 [Clostridia bacterium]|nr:hypothetical protein [Clostridia bacterium]